ncbi:hypothetical protein A3I18_01005 [Candidatus Campbellbacteria bacterium RIFCSPLOWO2_02_FULL_35_11]|uniref:Uncharacterized protein n=2 Tax=Candidatus Campbelliibacteriota TaxID=1752727 RepID=A0A1F5EKP2_9BACT|nr:MAG: hypothetical protein A3E89_02245 [Candidatus Campbellbacteria bacterium RIFCSPHIGHO2_12_FULL_35_10]OGD69685.1 MAG: hypothetical protein A3I18_01005 [Candidatus Campbellbacteria bacterium RIFCSPLOWO2_02_FULL_35_11]
MKKYIYFQARRVLLATLAGLFWWIFLLIDLCKDDSGEFYQGIMSMFLSFGLAFPVLSSILLRLVLSVSFSKTICVFLISYLFIGLVSIWEARNRWGGSSGQTFMPVI